MRRPQIPGTGPAGFDGARGGDSVPATGRYEGNTVCNEGAAGLRAMAARHRGVRMGNDGAWDRRLWAFAAGLLGVAAWMAFAPTAAATWVYRSLDHEPSEVRDLTQGQVAYARQAAGNLTRLRIGETSYYTRLVLDFDDRARFVVSPISDRTLEISILKLRPDQVSQQLDAPKGLITAYRFEPDGTDGTKLIVQAAVPISISVMGDLAPDQTLGNYRLFFDFVERGRALTNPAFVQRPVDLGQQPTTGALPQATPQPSPQPDIVAQDRPEGFVADDVDPRDEGFYVRASGGYAFTANTRDDIATISDDAGNGYKAAGALGYRPLPFLRTELEGGRFGGFEVENAAGKADVDGWYAALNGFIALSREFWIIRPYVGAGIGLSRNSVDDLPGSATAAPAGGDDKVNFLWQLFAGAEMQVIDNLSADLGYRFAHHGEITSDTAADGATYNGDLRSHEVYLGVIYDF